MTAAAIPWTPAQLAALEDLICAATEHVGPLPVEWAGDDEPLHDGADLHPDATPEPWPEPSEAEMVEIHRRLAAWGVEIPDEAEDMTMKKTTQGEKIIDLAAARQGQKGDAKRMRDDAGPADDADAGAGAGAGAGDDGGDGPADDAEDHGPPRPGAEAPGLSTLEGKRRGNVLIRKLTGQATDGDQATWSEGEFSRTWSLVHGLDEFLFVKGVGWLRFDSGIWRDGASVARRFMASTIKDRVQQTKSASKFDRASAIDGALKMAQVAPSETRTVEVSSFDNDPMTVGLPGGRIFEVSTGEARSAKPQDRIRKTLAVAPSDEPSRLWADFVFEALCHYPVAERDEIAAWLQEFCGAMLTGDCRDQKCLFIWGSPGSGKTVFAETLRHVMADYAFVIAGERLAGRDQGHRQWVVGLAGRRLVLVNELPERGTWRTPDLNALIEGSSLEGNPMRQSSINFDSQASVVITGNHRPRAAAASGLWRRLVQVEFRNQPETPDPRLLDKLKAAAPDVLAWMCEGAARWHARGSLPQVPASIRQAVESYRHEADPVARYLAERTAKSPGQSVGVDDLYDDFKSWWLREIDDDEKSVPKQRGFGTKLNAIITLT